MHALAISLRWHLCRVPLPVLTLLVLLQRTPVVRLLLASESALVNAPLGQVLRSTALVATALGIVDTLAGATEFFADPQSPANATVGESFSAGFSIIGAPAPTASYTIGDLPPGLSVPGASFNGLHWVLNASFGSISGTPTTAGNYAVEITAWERSNGSGRSQTYFYEILVGGGVTITAPSITSHPASQTVTEGNFVSFSVGAAGTEPFSYQWYRNGGALSGATGSSYSIGSASFGDAGNYTVDVSNSAGTATSNAASLTVNPLVVAPNITSHPASQTVNVGTQVTFSVGASGTTPFSYQWYRNGSPIDGASGSTYTIASAQTTDAANYVVTVGNSAGTATSNAASLTVNPLVVAPNITAHPASQTVNVGTQVTFSVGASGTTPFSYQWYRNGSPIDGASGSTYTIASAQVTDAANYVVSVGNSAGTATSNAAALTVNKLAQSITFAGPANQGFTLSPVALSATASSGLTPTFVHVSGPATLSGTTLTLTGLGTVTVRAEQAGNSTYAAASSVTRSFTVSGNYVYWQYQNFTGPELTAGTVTGPTYVYGADGISNLLKYALGLPAKANVTSGLPVPSADATLWMFTYTRPAGQSDVTVVVEGTPDLVTWTTAGITVSLIGTSGDVETWRATVPRSAASMLFFRLRVTR